MGHTRDNAKTFEPMPMLTLHLPQEILTTIDAICDNGLFPNRADLIRYCIVLGLSSIDKVNENIRKVAHRDPNPRRIHFPLGRNFPGCEQEEVKI